jgi:peptidoglycan/LPS O-acetylase OafA/YrhL
MPRYYAELAWMPVVIGTAWLLYTFVEEPGRRMMRRMLAHDFIRAEHPLLPAYGDNAEQGAVLDTTLVLEDAGSSRR